MASAEPAGPPPPTRTEGATGCVGLDAAAFAGDAFGDALPVGEREAAFATGFAAALGFGGVVGGSLPPLPPLELRALGPPSWEAPFFPISTMPDIPRGTGGPLARFEERPRKACTCACSALQINCMKLNLDKLFPSVSVFFWTQWSPLTTSGILVMTLS